ncbi:MAG: YbjN domain-containing protein [Deltaproteobacteria bacterium]|nr:YbjN domain-containing protein [Deltaproteobacteria bacterium]
MDADTLRAHLEALEWPAVPHGKDTFKSEHDTDEGKMTVYVRLHENWLVASVVPFLSTGGDNSFELARWLLRMNRDMFMTKFAYDEDGDVVLTVELPTENLDPSEVSAALSGLLGHAIGHRRTLRLAAEE